MSVPTAGEYQAALQNPAVAFQGIPELARAAAETNRNGLPKPYSGNFTATFRMQGEGEGEWAARCYTREVRNVAERYRAITRFLESRPDPLFSMAKFVRGGILVGAANFDIIQMDWVSGVRLDDWVTQKVKADPASLEALASSFLDLGNRLHRLGIAHGDLQHGNVIVQDGDLRLIDYDDLFLPDLRHLQFSSGLGQENYQHPKRVSTNFDEKLDRFSIISIYITLRALSAKPQLWRDFDGGDDNLLFRKSDFIDPAASPLFRQLDTIPAVKEFVDRFASVCTNEYEQIPCIEDFLDGRFSYTRYVAKSPAASDEKPASMSTMPKGSQPAPAIPLIGWEGPSIGYAPARERDPVHNSPASVPHEAPRRLYDGPPSAAGIPPSGAGISLSPGARWSSEPVEVTQPANNDALLRIGGGVVAAVVLLAVLLVLSGHHSPRKTPALSQSQPADTETRLARTAAHPRSHPEASKQIAPTIVRTAEPTPTPQSTPARIALPPVGKPRANAPPATRPQSRPRRDVDDAAAKAIERNDAPPVPLPAVAQPIIEKTPACTTPDEAAHLITRAAPDLSPQTLAAAAGKSVVVSVDVAADGSVRNTSIVTASGETSLDLAALSVATRSAYASAEGKCVAAPGTVTVTVSY